MSICVLCGHDLSDHKVTARYLKQYGVRCEYSQGYEDRYGSPSSCYCKAGFKDVTFNVSIDEVKDYMDSRD